MTSKSFHLIQLNYHFPYPLLKSDWFAGNCVPVLDGPIYKRIFPYVRPLPPTPNCSFMIYPAQIVWPL